MQHVEPWYSVEEIANHLGISKETIGKLVMVELVKWLLR